MKQPRKLFQKNPGPAYGNQLQSAMRMNQFRIAQSTVSWVFKGRNDLEWQQEWWKSMTWIRWKGVM